MGWKIRMNKFGPIICGMKLSACCTVINAWGIIQLGLLGYFFSIKSVLLLNSVIKNGAHAPELSFTNAPNTFDKLYKQFSQICYHACMMCACVFVISFWQFFVNIFPRKNLVKGAPKSEKKQDYSKALRLTLTRHLSKPEGTMQPESVLKYIHTH